MVKPEIQTEVVISGIGGYFPRSVNIDDFQKLLLENVHIQDPARWKTGQMDICDTSSNVPNIDCFDASYFGIHRQQCTYMDPMQRTILEKTFEAIIDAGLSPNEVRGKKVGVYMGSCISENDSLMFESVENGFGITGQARTMLANRISYWLNVTGPSCSFDVSWTNGAQIINFALEAIRNGQIEAAVVGTTNLALNIYPTWLYKSQGYTSNDGVTRAFDENAEGYSRGEGIIALYLQRADQCKRCYATVVHADAQYNGNRDGRFSQMNLDGFTNFLTDFYKNTEIKAKDVDYIEAYGSGIKRVDEIELKAVETVFCKERTLPLPVGSVKTVAGHAEAAEAFMSLVKVVIAMESGTIPATLHHTTPNKNIPALINKKIEIVTENRPWTGQYAAINSVGLVSSYGHILIRANPKPKIPIDTDLPLLRIASSRTEEGLKEILKNLAAYDTKDLEYTRLINDVFSSNIFGHLYRGYMLKGEKVKEELEHSEGTKRPTWFIYSGMGSQWVTMGKSLMVVPIFAKAIDKCHNVLATKGVDLKQIITTDDPKIFDNILHSFVGIAAIQIGLTDILHAVGIVPDGIVGHSVGELGCAYADGCLTAEQMILSAYYRGKASLESQLIVGMMAAIGMGADQLKKIVPPSIDVACHNGPDSSTLSGPSQDMEKFVAILQEKGVFARLVNVSNIAYHSRYIKPAAPLLLKYLKNIILEPVTRSSKWISTSIQESEWSGELAQTVSAEYLTNNLLSSVYFSEGCKHIPANAVTIEIAPHGLLQAILRRSLATGCVNIPLTKRGAPQPVEFLMQALGKLYLNGIDVKVAPLYPTVSYPVSKGTRSLTPLVHWEHSGKWRTGLEEFKDYSYMEKYYLITMNSEEFRDLIGHQVDGMIVLPVAAYLMLVLDVLSNVKRVESAIFENIYILKNILLSQKGSVPITVMVQRGSGNFEISEGQDVVVTGRIYVPESYAAEILKHPAIEPENNSTKLTSEEFYNEMEHRGYEFSGQFTKVKDVVICPEGSTAKIEWLDSWQAFITSMIQLQLLNAGESEQNLLMPSAIRRVAINFERQQEMNQDIDVVYHVSTGLVTSPDVQISGIKFDKLILDKKQILINNYKFFKFLENEIQDLQDGINVFLELLIQNSATEDDIQITEVKNKFNLSIQQHIDEICKQHNYKHVKINTVNSLKDSSEVSTLVVLFEEKAKELSSALKRYADFVLVCISVDEKLDLDHSVAIVASLMYNGYQYHLLKKVTNINPITIDVPLGSIESEKQSWITDMKKAVANIKNQENKRVFLVFHELPSQNIQQFVNELKASCDTENVRFAFILDRDVPKCSVNEEFYQRMYKQDIKITVYHNNEWGLYLNMEYPVTAEQSIMLKTDVNDIIAESEGVSDKCFVQYISADPRDFTRESEYVGYSALNERGQKVMGIARLDHQNMKITPNEHLKWFVPDHWSLEDAATVPYYYSMAYNVFTELTRTEARELVLIHDGCSSFGQAAISIAHSLGCVTYTTVGSEKQKAFLLDKFTNFSDHHIFSYKDCNFEQDLMNATNGDGVHIILNCFGGERLNATIRCLSVLGKIIHYRSNEIKETDYIGLGIFLKCTCMAGISGRKLISTPLHVKNNIQALVEKGMKLSYVKILEKIVYDQFNKEVITKYLESPTAVGTPVVAIQKTKQTVKYLPLKKEHEFVCNKNESYVIIGDDQEKCLDLIEWLVHHRAKKVFAMSSESTPNPRRLFLLNNYNNAKIKFLANTKLSSSNISDLILNASKSGSISTVFILPSERETKNSDIVYSVNAATSKIKSKPVHVICVWGDDQFVSYKKNDTSNVICNVRWEDTRKFSDLLKILNKIMEKEGDILIRNEQMDMQPEKIYSKDFCLVLPQSYATLKHLCGSQYVEPKLRQLASSCPMVVREIPPMFVFPGLSGEHCPSFKYLIKHLMYPVHCLVYAQSDSSLEKQASQIATDVMRIQHTGPYNLLGVSWGGALSLEVARKLEEAGGQTQLFLADAVPDTIQAIIAAQGNPQMLETQIIANLLDIKEQSDIKNILNQPDWPSKVKYGKKCTKYAAMLHKNIDDVLNFMKYQVDQMMNYQFEGKIINGPTKLFRPQNSSKDDSFGLTKYCKEVEIKIVTGNHSTMLTDHSLIDYINDNILI